MRLEHIEKVCLDFLRQTTNPLVPVETLYAACTEQGDIAFTRAELLHFLRSHAEVLVVDGADSESEVSTLDFLEAGIHMGPRAILKTRIPTREEMADMMQQQLAHMRSNLREALAQARSNADHTTVKEIEAALVRSDQIEAKVKEFFTVKKA